MTNTKIGSACSGYGGLDGAVTDILGGDIAWHVEYDDAPSRLLDHHHPGTVNHHDVTAVDWAGVEPVDKFAAGYPCQPFGLSGLRQGVHDARHLWPYLAKGKPNNAGTITRPGAIAALRPRIVVAENVQGHLSLGFDHVLSDLHDLGYDVRWTVAKASDLIGACHSRARLFFIATERGTTTPLAAPGRDAAAVLDNGWWHHQEGLFGTEPFRGRCPAAGVMINGRVYELDRPRPRNLVSLLPTPRTSDTNGPGVHGNGGLDLRTAIALLPTPWTGDWGVYAPAIERWAEVIGRAAPTPRMTNAQGLAQLCPVLVEWMMGLPEGHVTQVPGLTRAQQLKLLGNGVVRQHAAAALSWLTAQCVAEAVAA